ncbi:MAG: GWxTD domain-containing protein [Bacteroidota bacterium]|nr:GWxTD domain-containing protein [Bacteroidota bacterium]
MVNKAFSRLLAWLFFLLPVSSFAIPDVSMEISRFRTETSTYVEMSLYIVGSSLTCWPGLSGEYGVNYTVLIKDSADHILSGNKYRLSNTTCPARDLIDVRRFNLTPGVYNIEVELVDFLDSLNKVTVLQTITINAPAHKASLSDIQLFSVIRTDIDGTSALHKSGMYLEPLAFGYFYPTLSRMNIYAESYHADQLTGQPYLQYTISAVGGNIPPPIVAYRKVDKKPISSNVYQIDITTLITGPYLLETSLFDGNKILVDSRKIQFSRYSPEADSIFLASGALNIETSFAKSIPEDSLDYALKAMVPIVGSNQVEIMNGLLKKGNADAKQFFIHRYWTEEAGKYGGQAYTAYMKVARYADQLFGSGFGYGFETDRGYLFLKYGKPDDIVEVEDEPSAPPYEIWFYNTFPSTHQNNVKFLFYNPSLAKNAYKLLHSNAIGEVKNEQWELELYRDALSETPGVGEKQMGDNVNRNARKYFETF